MNKRLGSSQTWTIKSSDPLTLTRCLSVGEKVPINGGNSAISQLLRTVDCQVSITARGRGGVRTVERWPMGRGEGAGHCRLPANGRRASVDSGPMGGGGCLQSTVGLCTSPAPTSGQQSLHSSSGICSVISCSFITLAHLI